MASHDFKREYIEHVARLKAQYPLADAMSYAVGGDFKRVGGIERSLLFQEGLCDGHYLIDVGCGSGRLAYSLKEHFHGKYLGIDVVPDLLDYARSIAGSEAFRFEIAEGLSIPEADGAADYVCFFSVFTHLRHEESYVYFREAKRVLRPGGRIVFSFLDITEDAHWQIFEGNVADIGKDVHLNQFLSEDMISVWLDKLQLRLLKMEKASHPFISVQTPFTDDKGNLVTGNVALGQSVCIAEKFF
ncbi:MAG: hypothetical protein BWK80_62500 [Desulfobacteraceae bacterium IS3]|nr:MAG: hypothetical protein BWK80_62500 [Desulfobacteraceae bacterium IS3]